MICIRSKKIHCKKKYLHQKIADMIETQKECIIKKKLSKRLTKKVNVAKLTLKRRINE